MDGMAKSRKQVGKGSAIFFLMVFLYLAFELGLTGVFSLLPVQQISNPL